MNTIFVCLMLGTVFIHECNGKGVAIFSGAANFRTRTVFTPHGPSDPDNYRTSYNIHESSYGTQFGERGLKSDTHIYNDNYKAYNQKGRKFLVEHLFKRENHDESKLGVWTESDDKRWRFTTKAPYFDNRIPRTDKILPASIAVGELEACVSFEIEKKNRFLGAASAFGLTSLLPLNIGDGKPLIYCPETDLAQHSIQLNGRIYSCAENLIRIICHGEATTSNPLNSTDNAPEACVNKAGICELLKFDDENLNCESGVLTSNSSIVCDSFEIVESTKTMIKTLQCHYGELAPKLASFIPTTESSLRQTTVKDETTSFYDDVKMFFKNLWSKVSDSAEEPNEPVESLDDENFYNWTPEALTINV